MKLFAFENFVGIFFATSVLFLLNFLNYWTGYLTHPFWSTKVNSMGMGIGLGLSVLLFFVCGGKKRSLLVSLTIALVLVIVAYFLTLHFKEVFAASYAEDRTAGQIWYFGFMSFIAFAFTVLAMIPAYVFARLTD